MNKTPCRSIFHRVCTWLMLRVACRYLTLITGASPAKRLVNSTALCWFHLHDFNHLCLESCQHVAPSRHVTWSCTNILDTATQTRDVVCWPGQSHSCARGALKHHSSGRRRKLCWYHCYLLLWSPQLQPLRLLLLHRVLSLTMCIVGCIVCWLATGCCWSRCRRILPMGGARWCCYSNWLHSVEELLWSLCDNF